MNKPNEIPEWLQRQFDSAEATVATWSDGKCEAAGIPRQKSVSDLTNLIAEAKRLEAATTKGPWKPFDLGNGMWDVSENHCEGQCLTKSGYMCECYSVLERERKEDMEFIAFARTALPALVTEVERLQRCLDQAISLAGLEMANTRWVSSVENVRPEDSYPDLCAELKARN